MRMYTIISSEYGTMPSAGFAQKMVKIASDYDGWDAIQFLTEFSERERKLEDNNDELFFCISGDCEMDFSFIYKFFNTEEDMIAYTPGFNCPRYFRLFSYNENFGLEELEMLKEVN